MQVREKIRQLRHINSALEFFDSRLAQIEDFVAERTSDKMAEKVMKNIEKLVEDLEKELDKTLKDLRKLFGDFEKYISDLEDKELIKLLYFLMALSHVEVCNDGIYYRGDLIYDFDDGLSGQCCPFG